MKKIRLSALALAGALSLSLVLAGCSNTASPEGSPSPSPEVSAPGTQPSAPVPDPGPSQLPDKGTPPPASQPAESTTPAPSEGVTVPDSTPAPDPSEPPAQPSAPAADPTPAPTPDDSPAPAELSVSDVFEAVAAKAGGNAMDDMSFALIDFYPDMDLNDLESYGLYMPPMSSTTEEIFIAKVKSGAMDRVKKSCEGRQQAMVENANFYPGTGNYVDDYELVSEGSWVLFVVVETPAAAVEAFQNCVK